MVAKGNVGVAMAMVIGAGMATTAGSLFVFCTNSTNKKILAAALGASAGVMLYVSFVEIFATKALSEFIDAGLSEKEAYRYGTVTFFGGMVFTFLLDQVTITAPTGPPEPSRAVSAEEALRQGSDELYDAETGSVDTRGPQAPHDHHDHSLTKMGVMTAVALGLHNFPEGLATFVAALVDPTVGLAIAVAIALHNIPEGLCVAMPVYYATGSRWKGVMWATVSGISEPVAGLFGWLVLSSSLDPVVYAVLFAAVAGMMVYISLRELLPTALRNDPEDTWVTYSCFGGMAVMATSLLAFSETS